MPIQYIDRNNFAQVKDLLKTHFASFAEQHGVVITFEDEGFTQHSASFRVQLAVANAGAVLTPGARRLVEMGASVGLPHEQVLNKVVSIRGTNFRVLGYDPTKPTFAIEAERCYDKKPFRLTPSDVQRQLGLPVTQERVRRRRRRGIQF